MVELWYSILVLMTGIFLVFDGWDIGAGALHLIIAKTDAQRRTVISAIGPLWVWHETWLVGVGGVLILAFPAIMSTLFSGFYLAFFLLLWGLIGRGVAIELAGHIRDSMWRSFWDTLFAFSNILLAILLGLAFGNLIRGVPLGPEGYFTLSFFTHFGVEGSVGILDWYTLSVAVFLLTCLTAHGASYLALRTEGVVNERSHRIGGRLWLITFILLPIVTVMTWFVRPEMFMTLIHRPLAWPLMALLAGGVFAVVTGWLRCKELQTFLGGCAFLFCLLGVGAVGVYPVMLRSTISVDFSLTAQQGGAYSGGLIFALFWWPVSFLLAFVYMIFIASYYSNKVGANHGAQEYGTTDAIPDQNSARSHTEPFEADKQNG